MILKLAALGALGYAGYRYFDKRKADRSGAAFATGESGFVRNAGASAQADTPVKWNQTDDALDETFPASDAVAKY